MSDSALRDTIVAYLSEPAIDGIQDVYRDMPWFLDGGKWNLRDNGGWGAVAFVHIDRAQESRITMGGANAAGTPTGQKQIDYTVSVVVVFQYLIPSQLPPGAREDDWVRPLDGIIDALKDRIRADPTFGLGSKASYADAPMFQAGQGQNDIRQERDIPRLDQQNSKVVQWNRLEFDATQIITA